MFDTVYVFSRRVHTTVRRYVLTHVDDLIGQAHATDETTGASRLVSIDARDCLDPLMEIVARRDGICRIECAVDTRTDHVVGFFLCVDTARFLRHVSDGAVPSEEHVINLSRLVWRDAVVPCRPMEGSEDETPPIAAAPLWRDGEWSLYERQQRTLRWMTQLERCVPLRLEYTGNIRIAPEWYVDTECECITRDPSRREAVVRGGICGSPPGSGKTAIALRLIAQSEPSVVATPRASFGSPATLIVVPLNLLSQWTGEIEKFLSPDVRVCRMVRSQDLRNVTLQQLCNEFHIVLTTFYFLRSCPAYLEMVDAATGGRPRTRASLSAWMRQPNHSEPVLEAVVWRRIIVDEIHETFESARDMRVLRLFTTHCLWGLTGTPVLDTDQAQALYTLLEREKSHHPNLLHALVQRCVWTGGGDDGAAGEEGTPFKPMQRLQLVDMTHEERMHMEEVDGVEEEIRLTSFADHAMSDVSDPTVAFQRARDEERRAVVERIDSCHRTIDILGNTLSDLQDEKDVAREARETTTRELEKQRELCSREEERLRRMDERDLARRARLDALGGERDGGVRGVGSKLRRMGDVIRARAYEPIILFVQWKSMMRGVRSYLESVGARVLALEGNGRQRETTLNEFRQRGVLVLCMEDSFAGLHLPHARMVVFAHAIVGDLETVRRLERQAIARCVRPGQTSDVDVLSFVVSESDEEHHWRETHQHEG